MNGPENTLVAVVEVDETELDVVEAWSWPTTLIIPAVVEVIAGHTFPVTLPVTFICPIEPLLIAVELMPPAGMLPIMFPVTFIIPVEILEIVIRVPAPPALPASTFPVILMIPFWRFIIVVTPPPAPTTLCITFPIILIVPPREFNITPKYGDVPPVLFLPKTFPTILTVPLFMLFKQKSSPPLPELSWDVIVILPVL